MLHHFNFKSPVNDISFSPDGRLFAVTHGKRVQLWRAPGARKDFAPFVLFREFPGQYDDAMCIGWSADSRYVWENIKSRCWLLIVPLASVLPSTMASSSSDSAIKMHATHTSDSPRM